MKPIKIFYYTLKFIHIYLKHTPRYFARDFKRNLIHCVEDAKLKYDLESEGKE